MMTKNRVLTLFLMCVFPIHLWSLVVTFSNIETVMYRSTSVFDGIGYAAYALLLALLESALLCLLLWALGWLLPQRWPQERRLVQLTLIGWVILVWAALGQIYTFWFAEWQREFIDHLFLWLSYRRAFNPVALLLILLALAGSVFFPIFLFNRKQKFTPPMAKLFERVSLLSWLYLALDALALVVVFFRNLWVLL